MSKRMPPATRESFPVLQAIDTRWMDNDVYGHVNNVTYYSYFDTVVNRYLIENEAIGARAGHQVIGLVVETHCSFISSISFPDRLAVGIRIARIGTSSVRYELALFREGEALASAQGHYIHVYVDGETRRPVRQLPDALRQCLLSLSAESDAN